MPATRVSGLACRTLQHERQEDAIAPSEHHYDVYLTLDVGKTDHHACALDTTGRKIHDKALADDEAALRAVFTKLIARGRVLAVVDQPAAIGALAIAVARDMSIDIACLPACPG